MGAEVMTTEVVTRPGRLADWLIAFGGMQVVLGGLVAAVSGPLALSRGSWLAAYLVLVGGVAQIAMGGVASKRRTGNRRVLAQLLGWNIGNGAVMTGTMTSTPYVVDAGGIVLMAVLAILFRDTLHATQLTRWVRLAYLAMLAVLVASVPVGLALAHLRAG